MKRQGEEEVNGKKAPLVVDAVYEQMLDRIVNGEWPVGFTLSSERDLIEQFGVSRGALREAILRLRTLGVLRVSHGKRSVVSKMDSSILGRLFPLIMALNGEQTFDHVFQARLLLEMETVRLAAMHRSDEDLRMLDAILNDMDDPSTESSKDWARKDLSIHLQIARASQNPLYEPMLETLSGYLAYIQTIGIDGYPERQRIAGEAHHEIVEAIRNQNMELAQARMEAHVRSGANHIITFHLLNHSGVENRTADDGTYARQPRYRLDSDLVTKGLT
jgi:GntR family transcriptional repressor for pyruvate dehydrogenase complex